MCTNAGFNATSQEDAGYLASQEPGWTVSSTIFYANDQSLQINWIPM